MTPTGPDAPLRRPVLTVLASVAVLLHVVAAPVILLGGFPLWAFAAAMITAGCESTIADLPQCDGTRVAEVRALVVALALAGPVAGTVALVLALLGRTAWWLGFAGAWVVSLLCLRAILSFPL